MGGWLMRIAFIAEKEGAGLEGIARLLGEVEAMEAKIAKREGFKESNWGKWQAESAAKREAFRQFKKYLLAASQSAQSSLQRARAEGGSVGAFSAALCRRLLCLNQVVERLSKDNIEKLGQAVREVKKKEFEAKELCAQTVRLEGGCDELKRKCDHLRLEIAELGALQDVERKKEELEGQIEERAHTLQALINEQNDLIVSGWK